LTNDSLKNLFLSTDTLDRAKIAFKLVMLDERSGLLLIFVQPYSNGLLLVIFPLIKGSAASIANPIGLGRMKKNVKHRPTVLAGPPAREPSD
jgi:hypothetical protein